ncbi:MAG: PAS domain S-box protein, partial [Syntrophales bacterium LBB04]|nr:PAS domain S-box protein [Syntrophales bacterium LBB04]
EDITEKKLAIEALRESEKAAKRLAQENELIAEIGRIISSTLNIEDVYGRFAEKVREAIPFDRIAIATVNTADDSFTIRYANGEKLPANPVGRSRSLAGSGCEHVMLRKSSILVTSANRDEMIRNFPGISLSEFGIQSMMLVPLISKDEVIGSLVTHSLTPDAYSQDDLLLAEKMGLQIAGAIANAELFYNHRQMEEELRMNQARGLAMLSNIADVIAIIDINGINRYKSPNIEKWFGWRPGDVVGVSTWENVHPEDLEHTQKFFAKLLEKPNATGIDECRYRCKDGSYKWIEFTAVNLVHNPDINGVLLNYHDITGRKEAEKEMRESEAKYRSLASTVDSVFLVDRDRRIIFANDNYLSAYGDMKDSIVGTTYDDFHSENNSVIFADAVKYVIDTGNAYQDEWLGEKRNRWILRTFSPVKDGNQAINSVTIVAKDINDRKLAEKALRESENRYKNLFDKARDGILLITADGKIVDFNQSFADMHGYTRDELSRMDISQLDVLKEKTIEEHSEYRRRNLNGEMLHFEVQHYHKDGHIILLDVFNSIIEISDQQYSLGFHKDITNVKAMEQERKALEERLHRSEKMEALGKLAGGVAHDLNNVLGVLSGYSELLRDMLPAGSPLKEYANHIFKSSEKGAAIIQDLLTLARRGVVVANVIDLNFVVSNLLETPEFNHLQTLYPNVTFDTEFGKDLMNIKGSAVHLEKTVMNLISNAAEAIIGDGKVSIRTENRYLDKAVRGYDTVYEGDYVVLSVSDTGEGISGDDLNKIFEPFYTRKSMGRSGTGLGLAIVWGTVQDHKGYIDISSVVGGGTTFTLYLPVTREEIVKNTEKIPVEQYMGQGELILVVDDVYEQRLVAKSILESLGYQSHSVASGEEAVEYLKSNKADLMILDMIMEPGIDGLETFKRVREQNPYQKTIIVSGFAETERVNEAQLLGVGTFVKKPYIIEKIGMAIRRELER